MTAVGASLPVRRVQPWLTTAARAVLAVILGWAGLAKVSSPAMSVLAVEGYQLFPPWAATVVGYGLPFLELALAALLLAGLGTRVAGIATAALFAVFIAGIVSAWARGLAIDCGCFGGGGQIDPEDTRYGQEILRDVGIAVLAGWVAVSPRSRFALDGAFGGADDPGSSATDNEAADDKDEDEDDGGSR